MIKQIVAQLRARFLSDHQQTLKAAFVLITLSVIGKSLMVIGDSYCGLGATAAQFVPTLPIFGLTFLAHRYLWQRQEVSLLSYVGGVWSATYVAKLLVGHGTMTFCTSVMGWDERWEYLTASSLIGALMALTTFVLNEIILGSKGPLKTETV